MMQKQKINKILRWATIGLLSVGAVLLLVQPSLAQSGAGTGGSNQGSFGAGVAWLGVAFVGLLSKLFGLIAGVVADIIMPIVMRVLDTLLIDPDWVFSEGSKLYQVIKDSHEAALSIANGFLLLGLMAASVAIILRVGAGTYNIKKFLGSFVMMAVLANLSKSIFDALLEIGKALFNSVSFIFEKSTAITLSEVTKTLKDLAELRILDNLTGNVPGTILVLITMLISAWVLIKVGLLLVERTITLFILLIIAPISFGLSVLPTTQKMASQWFDNVIKWMLALPITYAILALGVYVLQKMGEPPSEFIYRIGGNLNLLSGDTIAAAPLQIAQVGTPNIVEELFMFIIGMTLIYMGGTVPKMLKIGGAVTGMLESPQKMVGAAQKTGTQAWKSIADTATGKNVAGKAWQNLGYKPLINSSKGFRNFEGWRQTRTGALGAVINPFREADRKTSDSEFNAKMSRLGANTRLASKKVPENEAPIAKWWRENILGENPNAKASGKFEEKGVRIKAEDWDSPQSYADDINNGYSSKNNDVVGKARVGVDTLSKMITQGRNPAMRKAAAELWQKHLPQIEALGLQEKVSKYLLDSALKGTGKDDDEGASGSGSGSPFVGGTGTSTGPVGDKSSAGELQLARNQAARNKRQKALSDKLKTLPLDGGRLNDKEAAVVMGGKVLDELVSKPGLADSLKQKISPKTLQALASSDEGKDIMRELGDSDPTMQKRGIARLKATVGATDEEASYLIEVAQKTDMSPAEIQVAKRLSQMTPKKGKDGTTKTLTDLVQDLKKDTDAIRGLDKETDDLSTQVKVEGGDTEQNYKAAVDVLIQDRVTKGVSVDVTTSRQQIHQESSAMYNQLVTKLGEVADATDDMYDGTVGQKIRDVATKKQLSEFFAKSGPSLGTGMTNPTDLNNTRLSQVLQRVRLIRQNTKPPKA